MSIFLNNSKIILSNVSFFSPIGYAWKGGKFMSADPNFPNLCISRQDYEEMGCRNLVEKLIEEEEKNDTA